MKKEVLARGSERNFALSPWECEEFLGIAVVAVARDVEAANTVQTDQTNAQSGNI